MRRFFARLSNLLRSSEADREMLREMSAHLALLQDEFEAKGFSPKDAALAARRTYGSFEQAKELHRDARSFTWLENLVKDIRYGLRDLLRTPGFTIVAIVVLALGIGANTAIFSVVNSVLLEPLAYKDSNRLVTILHNGNGPVATANYLDWREQSTSFEAMGGADFWTPNLSDDANSAAMQAEQIYALKVTSNLLPLLGVDPILGRLFRKGEDQEGADKVAVLGYSLWQRRFHGDRDILGKAIRLDGEGYIVVGVMPSTFHFAPFWATRSELWVPNSLATTVNQRHGNHLRVFARLKPGITLERARADIATVTARLEKQFPATNRDVVVRPLKENVVGKVETPLLLMLGAVAFVLLIACANVAHMLLARVSDRQKEVAVRAALGAGKARLFAQFLTENLLLSGMGASLGLALAFAAVKALVLLGPAYLPRVDSITVDFHAVLFLIAATVFTALAFGLAPALDAAGGNLSELLKEGSRGSSDSAGRNRLRSILVASEFALAFVLLVGTGLMIRTFYALQNVDTGFDPHNVLTMVVSVAGTQEAEAGKRETFYRELFERVRALPGVAAAGGINHLPLVGDLWDRGFFIEGRPEPKPGEVPNAIFRIAWPGYFDAMRLPLRRGRSISLLDNAKSPGVVVVNQCFADRFWPHEDPIGKRFAINYTSPNKADWLTVVGVVANASLDDLVSPDYPEMYLAALQTSEFMGLNPASFESPHMSYISLAVRTTGSDPENLITSLRKIIAGFDPRITVSQIITMDEAVANTNAEPRFEMLLLAVFGIVALVLAAVGIYGVMNYAVSRRTREIGIRMSLGANRRDILAMVLRRALSQVFIGSVAGMIGSLLLAGFLSKMLFGVKPTDPLTFVSVAVVLGFAAAVASAIPARRAIRIEPMLALRNE